VVKSAGLLPYHLLEAHRSRQSSYKVGTEAPHVTNKLSEAAKRIAAAEEDEEVLEVRPDGMRECNLLTFSFYGPWVKTIQLNARKKEADDIRVKVRNVVFHIYVLIILPHNTDTLLFSNP
jgi:hypothetical protein